MQRHQQQNLPLSLPPRLQVQPRWQHMMLGFHALPEHVEGRNDSAPGLDSTAVPPRSWQGMSSAVSSGTPTCCCVACSGSTCQPSCCHLPSCGHPCGNPCCPSRGIPCGNPTSQPPHALWPHCPCPWSRSAEPSVPIRPQPLFDPSPSLSLERAGQLRPVRFHASRPGSVPRVAVHVWLYLFQAYCPWGCPGDK